MSLLRTKNVEQMIAASSSGSGLRKTLGALDLTFLGIGAIVGTGIFVLTGAGAALAGPALTLSFALAALACCFAAFAYAEFASTIPVAGSIYTYTYATLGELAAWLIGWDLLLEYGLASSAVAVGWSGYFQALLSGFGITLPAALTAAPGTLPGQFTLLNLPALLIVAAITALLSVGVRESLRINNLMVSIKIGVVLLVIAVGAFHVQPANWRPFIPMGLNSVLGTAAVMFFAFIGFDSVSSAAEEVKNPKRDLPIGIILSLGCCTLLYMAVAAVLTGIVPYPRFENIANPVSFALHFSGEKWVAGLVDLGAVVGMLTVMLVMGYAQTRIIFAMSRDGLLPAALSKIHPHFATPLLATWGVGLLVGLIAAFVPLEVLAELINIGTLAAFSMVSVAVLILRRTHPALPRAFRCPGVPGVPLLSVALCLFLMLQLRHSTWLAFISWLAFGLLIYFGYSRCRATLAQQSQNI